MKHPIRAYVGIALFTLLIPASSFAQWLDYVPEGTPLKDDGTVNLSAPTPRTADGKPDLSGVWDHEKATLKDLQHAFGPDYDPAKQNSLIGMEDESVHKYGFNALLDVDPEQVKLTPEGEALMQRRRAERDTSNVCHSEYGWPVLGLLSEPIKLVQAPEETVLLYEIDHEHRQIFADGRKFPEEFNFPAFLGYSIGHWEGDTFVVDTRGFNERTPIDAMGHPRSESMHVTERYSRPDYGHLHSEVTFDDPTVYTKPFTITINYDLVPNFDIFEMYCNQNEKDREHMVEEPKAQ